MHRKLCRSHKLNVCKFCGSPPIYEHEGQNHLVYCSECSYETKIHNNSLAAQEEWNKKKDAKTKKK